MVFILCSQHLTLVPYLHFSKQTRLCEESNKMVNDSSSRLGIAVGELRELVASPSFLS